MTARKVLLVLLAAFFLTALLLIHNAFYQPGPTDSVEPPAKVTGDIRSYS